MLRIEEVIWLSDIEEKVAAKHHLTVQEVEEVLLGRPHIRWIERGHTPGEDVYGALGKTFEGRYLYIVFILKEGRRALIVSARVMSDKLRKRYTKR